MFSNQNYVSYWVLFVKTILLKWENLFLNTFFFSKMETGDVAKMETFRTNWYFLFLIINIIFSILYLQKYFIHNITYY